MSNDDMSTSLVIEDDAFTHHHSVLFRYVWNDPRFAHVDPIESVDWLFDVFSSIVQNPTDDFSKQSAFHNSELNGPLVKFDRHSFFASRSPYCRGEEFVFRLKERFGCECLVCYKTHFDTPREWGGKLHHNLFVHVHDTFAPSSELEDYLSDLSHRLTTICAECESDIARFSIGKFKVVKCVPEYAQVILNDWLIDRLETQTKSKRDDRFVQKPPPDKAIEITHQKQRRIRERSTRRTPRPKISLRDYRSVLG